MIYIIILVVIALLFLLYVGYGLRKRSKLSKSARKKIAAQWDHTNSLSDSSQKIMEADKVLDSLLNELGYQGSLGEKLKQAGPRLPNLDAVWRAHKLRNRLAHEPGVKIDERGAQRAMMAFENVIKKYM